jgi:CBS domain containing-hemolysin-like protein
MILLVAVFDHSFGRINRIKIELDDREGEKYPETLNLFYNNREDYRDSISFAKSFWSIIYAASFVMYSGFSVWSILILLLLYIVVSEIIPRIITLFATSVVPEKLYMPVKYNFKIYIWLRNMAGLKRHTINTVTGEEEERRDDEEMEIIKNLLDLPDVKLRECLIPRNEICAVPLGISKEELLEKFIETKYSRLPVYEGSIDKIAGYYHTRDFLSSYSGNEDLIIRPVHLFPENMSVREALSEMIRKHKTLCVVLDEYGGTAGIVTLEDLIEEIFGDIEDELDRDDLLEKRVGERDYIFSGRQEVKYLNREYGFTLPEREEYETLGGMILFINENIPHEGEIFVTDGYRLKVLKVRNNSVASVYLRILD